MAIHLLSFVAGMPNGSELADRLNTQAIHCKYLNHICIVSSQNSQLYKDFHDQYGIFVKNNPRGYGYWLWKPFIALKYLKQVPENDVVLYCDIGCELSPLGGKVFAEYIDYVQKHDFLAFSTFNKTPERAWTKAELINLLSPSREDLESEQVAATFFLIKNNSKMIHFLEEWLSLCLKDDCRYLTDKCMQDQDPIFIEHRHDQSIFSLLVKKWHLQVIRERTFFPPEVYYSKSFVLRYPVHTLRTKDSNCFISAAIWKHGLGLYWWQFSKYQFIFMLSRIKRKSPKFSM